MADTWMLEFDGAVDRNGEPDALGGYGWQVYDTDGTLIADGFGPIHSVGKTPVTNNIAEWAALLKGLKWLRCFRHRPARLIIRGDSQLVINTLSKRWSANKYNLAAFRDAALQVLDEMSPLTFEALWIAREENEAADHLSKKGLGQAGR